MSVTWEKRNGVGVIWIDHPPVNALSSRVAAELGQVFVELEQEPELRAYVLTARGRTFVAGADVKEFQQMIETGRTDQGAGLYELTNRLELSQRPVVCALFGTTLGGGLELAMACHYRVALAGSWVGQPEVKLGLIPGAGGTQRLPRLCGLVRAAEICAFGDPLPVEKALQWGIIDEVVGSGLEDAAIDLALRVSNELPRRTRDLTDKLVCTPEASAEIDRIRKESVERFQGARASVRALEVIEKAAELPFEDGLAIENEMFIDALQSEEARNLIHLFFAERAAARVPEIANQEDFRPANTVGFTKLYPDDVGLLEKLIAGGIGLKMVAEECLADDVDFVFLKEPPGKLEVDANAPEPPVFILTAEYFSTGDYVARGIPRELIVGLRYWPEGNGFAEIGRDSDTSPYAIKSVVRLLKKLGCSFVVEQPQPHYASSRVREHRLDESDLKIETWKLLQDGTLTQASDVDLIHVFCFGLPRHKAGFGIVPAT